PAFRAVHTEKASPDVECLVLEHQGRDGSVRRRIPGRIYGAINRDMRKRLPRQLTDSSELSAGIHATVSVRHQRKDRIVCLGKGAAGSTSPDWVGLARESGIASAPPPGNQSDPQT